MVVLGARGGCGGAIAGWRCRAQRLSHCGTRRLCVRLHEDQWGHAAGAGEMFLLDRRYRVDSALRPLWRWIKRVGAAAPVGPVLWKWAAQKPSPRWAMVGDLRVGERFTTFRCKRISLHRRWRRENECRNVFWLRSIRAENRIFVAASGFNDVSSMGS